jgi:aryl-alcohol dehydrogenase-like predicted oxidoreductase
MKNRQFGRSGWTVSEIGYGMWGMAGWSNSDDQESLRSLQAAVDLNCTFFDTAYAYGDGKSEGFLGEIARANNDKRLYTATKIPPRNLKWPAQAEFKLDDCYPPDHIDEYVRKSLKNSGLERFDLVQFHTWEDSWTDDRRWFEKMNQLRDEGLIQAVGIASIAGSPGTP